MTTPVSEATAIRLREAMVRLFEGNSKRTDGALTIVNLAREAQVSYATVHRAQAIKEEFAEEVQRRETAAIQNSLRRRSERLGDLKRKLSERNEQVRELRALNNALAQQVQFLSLANQRLRRDCELGRPPSI